ncbi:MAG: cytochrome P460 family protein [Cyanobacteria bacterium J06626_18]
MRGPFTSKAVFLKWIGLCLSAVVLAIALSHSLDFSPSPVASVIDSVILGKPITFQNAEASKFAVQERYGRRWRHYATVARNDDTFRQMFIEADVVDHIEAGQPLPDGTLILMESWYSPEALSIVFIKQKLNGTWLYGSFNPTQPNYQVSDLSSCHSCHAPFPETDFTLTKPLLEAAVQQQVLQTAYCDLPGRSPCAPGVYLPESEASS